MIPNNRILARKDKPVERIGSLILPSHYIVVNTGVVTESKIADVPVGSHVAFKTDTPEITLDGIHYFSASAKDILLVKPN